MNEAGLSPEYYFFGENVSGEGKKDVTLIRKPSGQVREDYFLVHNRYFLSREDNSIGNNYGHQGQNTSGQGQKDNFLSQMDVSFGNDECRLTNADFRTEERTVPSVSVQKGNGSLEAKKNVEYRLTNADFRFTGSNEFRFEIKNITEIKNKLAASSSWLVAKRNAEFRLTNDDCRFTGTNELRFEIKDITEKRNKLKAQGSRLIARNNKPKIKPDFALVAEEGTVVNFLKQSTAYET